MKPKNFIRIVIAVLLTILLVWELIHPAASPSPKTPAAPVPAKIPAPPVKAKAPQSVSGQTIAAPPVALVSKLAAASPTSTTPQPDPNVDPRADLKTAIPDIAHLQRTGDLIALWQTYTPPDQKNPRQLEQIRETLQGYAELTSGNPDMQAGLQKMHDELAKGYEDLEYQTPIYNAAGNEATYQQTVIVNGLTMHYTLTFIKINGKWYIKSQIPEE